MSVTAPGLLPIFRSNTQLRLLGTLFLHPETERTIADIEQETGIPQQTASREVARLLHAEILEGRRVGRQHLIKPNRANPYFAELSGLLLKAVGPRSVMAEHLMAVEGIDEAYIAGSWARRYAGESGPPPGDIDLVVVGEPDVDQIYEVARRAGTILSQEVTPVILTSDEWQSPRSGFVRELRRGPLVGVVNG